MSWDSYIENLDKAPGAVQSGLFGMDGNPWAVTKGFNPSSSEIMLLVRLLQGEELQEGESITVAGRPYTMYKVDDGKLCVLSKDATESERLACLVCQLTSGVIVSVLKAPQLQQACNYIDFYHNYLKQY